MCSSDLDPREKLPRHPGDKTEEPDRSPFDGPSEAPYPEGWRSYLLEHGPEEFAAHIAADTERWRGILRGLNREFRHQTVTTEQIERYLSRESGLELSRFFDQYLRGTEIPVFQYQIQGNRLTYRFAKVVEGFAMPLRVQINGESVVLQTKGQPQVYQAAKPIESLEVDRNFYVLSEPTEF